MSEITKRGNTSNRGFASMDPEQQRAIARLGGKAAAKGDTSNRGFASMDPQKQREIASKGGKASHKNDGRRAETARTGEDFRSGE